VHRTAQLIKSLTRGAAPAGFVHALIARAAAAVAEANTLIRALIIAAWGHLRRRDPQPPLARAEVPQAVRAGGPSVFVNPAQATTAPASRRRPCPRSHLTPDLFPPEETLRV
jgi:hypothetical protein